MTHVLPSEILMSIGMAVRLHPGVQHGAARRRHHDAGVASAVLNTSQQIGGSLGTALLNTLFAGAVTGYLADNVTQPGRRRSGCCPSALIHGYHVAFFWGAMLLLAALVVGSVVDQRPPAGRAGRSRCRRPDLILPRRCPRRGDSADSTPDGRSADERSPRPAWRRCAPVVR